MATSSGSVRAGRAFVEIFADNSKFDKTLHETEARFRNWGSQMTQVSGQLLTGMAAVGAPLGFASKLFAEFDESLRTVAATTGNFYGELNKESIHVAESFLKMDRNQKGFVESLKASQQEMTKLTLVARQLGRDTSFTAKEAADAMVVLARAGMKASEIQMAIKDTLNLARATGNDAADTATTIVGVLRAFRMEASQTQKITDLLAATVSNSPQNLADLGSAMKYVGSVSRSLNISLKTTLEDLGTLANFNIRGEQGGTALRNMYLRLTSASNQKKLKKAFDVDVVDSTTGDFRKFSAILADVKKYVDEIGVSSVDVATQFKDIFGMRSAPAALAMMNADVSQMRDSLSDVNGLVQAMSDEMNLGLSGAIKLLISKFQDLQIAIVGAFSGPLGDFLNNIGKAVNWATEFVERHKNLIKGIVTASLCLGGFVAAFAGLSFAIGVSVKSASGLLGIMRKLSQISMGSLSAAFKGLFGKQPKMKDPLEINLKSIDRARESTRYLNENVTALSKSTTIAIERFNRLSTSFERIANHAEGFKRATSVMAESNTQVTSSVKAFADNYRKLSDYLRTVRARINSTAGNLVNFKARLDSNSPSLSVFQKGMEQLNGAFTTVSSSIRRFASSLAELIFQSRHAINEVFYMNGIMRELPTVYKAAEASVKKLNKTFALLQKASAKCVVSIQSIVKLLVEVDPKVAVDKFSTLAASVRTAGNSLSYLNSQLGALRKNLKLTSKIGTDQFASIASIIKLSDIYNRLTGSGVTQANFAAVAQTRIQEMFDLDKKEQEDRIKLLQKRLQGGPQQAPPPPQTKMSKAELLKWLNELSTKFNEIANQFNNIVASLNIPVKALLSAMRTVARVFDLVNKSGAKANASVSSVSKNLSTFYRAIENVPVSARNFKASMQDVLRDIVALSETAQRIQRSLRNIGRAFSSIQIKSFAGSLRPLAKSLNNVAVATSKIISQEATFVAGITRMGDALGASAVGAQTFADALKSIASSISTLTPNIGKFNKQSEKSLSSFNAKSSKVSEKTGSKGGSSSSSSTHLPEYDKAKYANLKPTAPTQMEFVSRSRIRDQGSVISKAEARLQAIQDRYEQKVVKRDEDIALFKSRNKDTLDFQAALRGMVRNLKNAQNEVARTQQVVATANNELTVFEKAVGEGGLRKEARMAQLNLHIDNEERIIDSNNRQIATNQALLDTLKVDLRNVAKGTTAEAEISKKIATVENAISALNQSTIEARDNIRTYNRWMDAVKNGAVFEPSKTPGLQYQFFKDSNGNIITTQGEDRYANIATRGAFPVLTPTTPAKAGAPVPTLEEQATQRYEQWLASQSVPATPPKTAGAFENNAVNRQLIISEYNQYLATIANNIKKLRKGTSVQDYSELSRLLNEQIVTLRQKAFYEALSDEEIGLLRQNGARNYVSSEINNKQKSDIANLKIEQAKVQQLLKHLASQSAKTTGNQRKNLQQILSYVGNVDKAFDKAISTIESISGVQYKGLTKEQANLLKIYQSLDTWTQNYNYRNVAKNIKNRENRLRKDLQTELKNIDSYLSNKQNSAIDEKFGSRLQSRSVLEETRKRIVSLLNSGKSGKEFFELYTNEIGNQGLRSKSQKALSSLQYETFGQTATYQRYEKVLKTLERFRFDSITPEIANDTKQWLSGRFGPRNLKKPDQVYIDLWKELGGNAEHIFDSRAIMNNPNAKLKFAFGLHGTGMGLWEGIRTGAIDIKALQAELTSLKGVAAPLLEGLVLTKNGFESRAFGPGKAYQYDLANRTLNGSAKEIFESDLQGLLDNLGKIRSTLTKFSSNQTSKSIVSLLDKVDELTKQVTATKKSVSGISAAGFNWGSLSEIERTTQEIKALETKANETVDKSFLGRAEKFNLFGSGTLKDLQAIPKEFYKFIRVAGEKESEGRAYSDYKQITSGPKGQVDFDKIVKIAQDPEALRALQDEYETRARKAYFDKHIAEIDKQLGQSLSSEREKVLRSIRQDLVDKREAFLLARNRGERGDRIPLSREILQQIDPNKYAIKAIQPKQEFVAPVIQSAGGKTSAEIYAAGSVFEAALAAPKNSDIVAKYFVRPEDIEASRAFYTSNIEKAIAGRDAAEVDYDKAKEDIKQLLLKNPKYNQQMFERVLTARANEMIRLMQDTINNAPAGTNTTNMQTFLSSFINRSVKGLNSINLQLILDQYAKLFPEAAKVTGSASLTPSDYHNTQYLSQVAFPYLSDRNLNGLAWQPGERERAVRVNMNEMRQAQAQVAREQTRALLPEAFKDLFDSGSLLSSTLNQNVTKKLGKKLRKEINGVLSKSFNQLSSSSNLAGQFGSIDKIISDWREVKNLMAKNPNSANVIATDQSGFRMSLRDWYTFRDKSLNEALAFQKKNDSFVSGLKQMPVGTGFSKRAINRNLKKALATQDYAERGIYETQQEIDKRTQTVNQATQSKKKNLKNAYFQSQAQLKGKILTHESNYSVLEATRNQALADLQKATSFTDIMRFSNIASTAYQQMQQEAIKIANDKNLLQSNTQLLGKGLRKIDEEGKIELKKSLGFLPEQLDRYKKMSEEATSQLQLFNAMKQGYTVNTKKGEVIVKGKTGRKLVFAKAELDDARLKANQSRARYGELRETAKSEFTQSRAALDKFNAEQKEFEAKREAKNQEVNDQNQMIKKLEEKRKLGPLTKEDNATLNALRGKNRTSTRELNEMKLRAEIRAQEGVRLNSIAESSEKGYAQADANYQEASRNATMINRAYNQTFRPGRYRQVAVLKARQERGQAAKQLVADLNTATNGLLTGIKKAYNGFIGFGKALGALGTKTGRSVFALKSATVAMNALGRTAKMLGGFGKSVWGMLNMQLVMAAVGAITTMLTNAWNYYRSTPEERFAKAKEAADQRNERYRNNEERIKSKHEQTESSIQRLQELKEKDSLSETDLKEIDQIRTNLIKNGYSTQEAEKLTKTQKVYKKGVDQAVTQLTANDSDFKEAKSWNDVKEKNDLINNIVNFDNTGTAMGNVFRGIFGYDDVSKANLDSDLDSMLEMFNTVHDNGIKLTEQEKEKIDEMLNENFIHAHVGHWDTKSKAKWDELMKIKALVFNQNGPTSTYDIGAQQAFLNQGKEELDKIRNKHVSNPEDVRNAYDDYIANLTSSIEKSRNALEKNENKDEIQTAINSLTQELSNVTVEYENYLDTLQNNLQDAIPRFGAEKEAWDIVKSGASGSYALAQAQAQDLDIISKKYNAKEQREKNYYDQFYSSGGKLFTEDDILLQIKEQANSLDKNAVNYQEKLDELIAKGTQRLIDFRNNQGSLAKTKKEQEKIIEENNKKEREDEEKTLQEEYNKAFDANRIETQKILTQKTNEQLSLVGGAKRTKLENENEIQSKKDAYKGFWQYQAEQSTFNDQIEMEQEMLKPAEKQDHAKIKELRNKIKQTKETVMKMSEEPIARMNKILDRDKNTPIENTQLYYGDKEYAANLFKTQSLKREKQKNAAVNEIDYDIAQYKWVVDHDKDAQKVQNALQQIEELNFFKQMAENFYKIEQKMAEIKEQFSQTKFESTVKFGSVQPSISFEEEQKLKELELEKQFNQNEQKYKEQYDKEIELAKEEIFNDNEYKGIEDDDFIERHILQKRRRDLFDFDKEFWENAQYPKMEDFYKDTKQDKDLFYELPQEAKEYVEREISNYFYFLTNGIPDGLKDAKDVKWDLTLEDSINKIEQYTMEEALHPNQFYASLTNSKKDNISELLRYITDRTNGKTWEINEHFDQIFENKKPFSYLNPIKKRGVIVNDILTDYVSEYLPEKRMEEVKERQKKETEQRKNEYNQRIKALQAETAFRKANPLANGAEDFTNPYETYRQQQNQQAFDKMQKAFDANGIDSSFYAFNEDGSIRKLNQKETNAILKEHTDKIKEYEQKEKEARARGGEKGIEEALKWKSMADDERKAMQPTLDKKQAADRIIDAANADANANINSNYLDKMKENQDLQQDYLEKAYYQPQNDEMEMQLAMLESLGNTGNPLADKAYKMRSSQIRMGQAQMSLAQDQQKHNVLDEQIALAKQNLNQAIESGASEEVQQQLFKKYTQLLGEQQGVRQGMISTFKEMASIRGDFMKTMAATERASAGTFKAAEANRNSGDWQRENAIKQLNFLKQIAANTGMESDLL